MSTTFTKTIRRAALLSLACAALAAPTSAAAVTGDVSFMRNATSSFDSVVSNATGLQQTWMQQHYDRIRAYPPYFDRFLSWTPKTDFYIDVYAIYRDPNNLPGSGLLEDHPDWVLKDANGKKLYIPFGCGGGTCPQYAADFGNQGWRNYLIDLIKQRLAQGYAGVHLDDVNMEMRAGNGDGDSVRPIDPRTGSPMTDNNWNKYMADFMADIRKALPGVDISQNPLWFAPENDPAVQRQTDAADYIEMERGFNDQGLTGGSDRFSYTTYLDHVDWLHQRGKSVVFEPYDLDAKSADFEVASYLLCKDRDDMITSDYHANPGDWWSGWNVDLGSAKGSRYGWQGLIRRDFANGLALVNKPDSGSVKVSLGGDWTDLSGKPVSGSIKLDAREGVVLKRAGTDPVDPGDPDDPPVTPDPDDPPVTDPPPTSQPPAGIKIRPTKHRVHKGGRLRVLGKNGAPGASIAVKYRTPHGWRTLKRARVRQNGVFAARVRAARAGSLHLRAANGGKARSRVVKVKVV